MTYQVGDQLPQLQTPPMDRLRIAYMTVAMRDPNQVHLDDEYAARSGLPGVIAHGTFVVSYLGALVSRVAGVHAVRRLRVDVTAPLFPGDVLTLAGEVVDVQAGVGGDEVSVRLSATREDGTVVGRGSASFVAS